MPQHPWLLLQLVACASCISFNKPAFIGNCDDEGYCIDSNYYYKDTSLQDGDTFDYIVVGAGGAGAPAAARLALAGASVLLVEAGGDPTVLTKVPGAAPSLLGSEFDWKYNTIPNNVSCKSSRRQQCRFSRGKGLGGSTSINYMMYTRGNRRDYDDLGIEGWTWKDLKPYFLKYEGLQNLDKLPPTSYPYHNTDGTMKIGFFGDSKNPWHSKIISSFRFLNVPLNPDVNAESQIGVSQVIGYVHEGERMSTARGYLASDDVKKTLKIAKDTRCTGVILDDNNNAVGIKAIQEHKSKPVGLYARKEIILSAGAIGTPQILMLSGIGPAIHLNSLDIPVRADLPVGDNFSDHVLPLIYISINLNLNSSSSLIFDFSHWCCNRKGPMASNGLTDITVLLNTRCYDFNQRKLCNVSPFCELPTMQLASAFIDADLLKNQKEILQHTTNLKDDIIQQLIIANSGKAVIVASPVVLKPFSRGTIRLASNDPLEHPAIFPNYLADERDVEEMLRSIQILEHLIETPEYKAHSASIVRLRLPGCPEYSADRQGYWRCYCRHMTFSVFHAVGTARLGPVLDAHLRVRGVRGLRVADLSALPELPRGNTAAVAIAIGERVADSILQDAEWSNGYISTYLTDYFTLTIYIILFLFTFLSFIYLIAFTLTIKKSAKCVSDHEKWRVPYLLLKKIISKDLTCLWKKFLIITLRLRRFLNRSC